MVTLLGVSGSMLGASLSSNMVLVGKMTSAYVETSDLTSLRKSLQDVQSLIPIYQRFINDLQLSSPADYSPTPATLRAQEELDNLNNNEQLLKDTIEVKGRSESMEEEE